MRGHQEEAPIIIRRKSGALWAATVLSLILGGSAAFMAYTGWPHEPTVVVNVPQQPAPTVNVAAPDVSLPAPVINLPAPIVNVEPKIDVPAPSVTVQTESGYLKGVPPCHWWNRHTITCAEWRP